MRGNVGKTCAILLVLLIAGVVSIPKVQADGPVITVNTRAVVVGPSCVRIDIKPGSYPNCINLSCEGRIPVAILTKRGFDASTVDPSTVVFAGASPVQWRVKDVDRDGDLDLLLHFRCRDVSIPWYATFACLQASTHDGMSIHGCDSVHIVGRYSHRAMSVDVSSVLAGTHVQTRDGLLPTPQIPPALTSQPPLTSGPQTPPASITLPSSSNEAGKWHDSLPWAGATFGGGLTLVGAAFMWLQRPRR